MSRIILFIGFLGLISAALFSQTLTEGKLGIKSQWRMGEPYLNASDGNLACYNEGSLIVFLDVTDPDNVQKKGELSLHMPVMALEMVGDFAYAADGLGLYIIDVSDPLHPKITGSYTDYLIEDFAISGNTIIATDVMTAPPTFEAPLIKIIDISDPARPVLTGLLDLADPPMTKMKKSGYARDPHIERAPYDYSVSLMDSIAFIQFWSFLRVYNISDPENPVQIADYETLFPNIQVQVIIKHKENRLYFQYTDGENNFLSLLDITDPVNPVLGDSYQVPGFFVYALDEYENRIYVHMGNQFNYLQVLNVSDPGSFKYERLFSLAKALRGGQISTNGQVLLVQSGSGVAIVDIRNTPALKELKYFAVDGNRGIKISGSLAAVITTSWGLRLYDFSNPDSPELLSEISDRKFSSVEFHGDRLYATWEASLYAINITDPAKPFIESQYTGSKYVGEVMTFTENCIYLVEDIFPSTMRIMDISVPGSIKNLRLFNLESGWTHKIVVRGNTLYVSDTWNGLIIYDVSDPVNPQKIGQFDTAGWLEDFTLSGDRAYLADEASGVRIIDISDPKNPKELSYILADNYYATYNVGVSGHYLLADGFHAGFKLFDISDDKNPVEVGIFRSPQYLSGMIYSGYLNLFYINLNQMGLIGLQIDPETALHTSEELAPNDFRLDQNYPNPFNPVTTISYQIPAPGSVRIRIFNQAGQTIDIIESGWQKAGSHEVQWHAGDLASGIYYYQINFSGTENLQSTKKMILLK